MNYKVDDLVNIRVWEGKKLAKISDVMVSGWGTDYRVKFFEDGSEIVASGYLIEKIDLLELIKATCPTCGSSWKETVETHSIKKDCVKCGNNYEKALKEATIKLKN